MSYRYSWPERLFLPPPHNLRPALNIFSSFAREYMRLHHPSVLLLGFGETDECAHGQLITTDHGRGWKPNKWTTHGFWAKGSGDIWMAVLGPDIQPEGELHSKGQVYRKQMAATMGSLLGNPAAPGHPPGHAIHIPAVPRPAQGLAAK